MAIRVGMPLLGPFWLLRTEEPRGLAESMTWPRRMHSRGDPYTAAVMLGTPTQCGQPVLKTSFPTALQCFVL